MHNLAFWSEQYLLQALLMSNPKFEVLWGSSFMQSRASSALENAFPHWQHSYRNMPPGKAPTSFRLAMATTSGHPASGCGSWLDSIETQR